MKTSHWLLALAVAAPLGGGVATSAEGEKKPAREAAAFGVLRGITPAEARDQALAWLKAAGKADAAALQAAEQIWAREERAVIDRVADTLALGDADARKLLAEVRDPSAPAPLEVPAALTDAKRPAFYRNNLAVAYAKALTTRRVFEEALATLRAVKPEQVTDPAAYFFNRAVCEHELLQKPEATRTIARLLDEVPEAPERYKMVAALMHLDMQSWKEKDLGEIARKMENIERRLDLSRGGPQTQKLQKEVVLRLDELIKELENQAKSRSNEGC